MDALAEHDKATKRSAKSRAAPSLPSYTIVAQPWRLVARLGSRDLAVRHGLPPERTHRPARLSANGIVGKCLSCLLGQRGRRAGDVRE